MKRLGQTFLTICAASVIAASLLAGCSDASSASHQDAAQAARVAATPPSQRVSMDQARKNIEDNPNIPANAKAIILSHMDGNAPNPAVH